MVTSDQIVGRPRTECAVTSILTESATTPVNWYTSVIVQIKQSQKLFKLNSLKRYAARHSKTEPSMP